MFSCLLQSCVQEKVHFKIPPKTYWIDQKSKQFEKRYDPKVLIHDIGCPGASQPRPPKKRTFGHLT